MTSREHDAGPDRPPIVVGVDGSGSARFAAEWAADLAAAYRCPLHVVHAVPGGPDDGPPPPWPPWLREIVATAERLGADTTGDVVRESADRHLLRRARDARLVVVGSQGEGVRAGMLAGNLALALVAAAPCPVAVVRGPEPDLAPPRGGPVVVGSGAGHAAVLAAAELATASGAPLRIVRAVTDVSDAAGAPHRLLDGWPALLQRAGADLRADADVAAERFPHLTVSTEVVTGTALQVLLDASRSARAVVVGRRDRPPSGDLALGSTGRGLTGFAGCPVVVVPPAVAGPVAPRVRAHRSTVSDVMTTDVRWVPPDASFADITAVLRAARIRAVPVLDPDHRLLGVVSEADLLATVARADRGPGPRWWRPRHTRHAAPAGRAGARDAAALMSPAPVTAAPDDPVAAAARRMRDRGVAWMPVVAGDRVVGVLGRSDLLAVFHRDDDAIRAEVVDEVFRRILLVDPARVRVEVRGGVVTLEGELDTRADVELAVRFSERTEGVVAVVDRLRYRVDDRAADLDPVRRY